MKKLFIIMAIATMAFVSCSKEQLNTKDVQTEGEVSSYTLAAVAPGDDATKTSLQKNEESGKWNVLWSEGDALKVKVSGDCTSASHYAEYTLESGAGAGNAVFKGTVEAPDQVFAFYPSSLVNIINNYGMFFDIPTEQTYSSTGEVSNNSLPMWANGDRTNLSFNHVCSIIRIPVYINESSVTLDRVDVSSNRSIFGQWYFQKSGFNNNPLPASGAKNYTVLNCDALTLSTSESEPTILNIIAGVDKPGSCGTLDFIFTFSDGGQIIKSTSSLSTGVETGKIYKLPVLKLQKVASDLQIKIDDGSWENWDGVSDIDAPETSVAVKGTSSVLTSSGLKLIIAKVKSGENRINLDFSAVRMVSSMKTLVSSTDLFKNNTKINNVILPEGLTSIDGSAFMGSTVQCVTIPASVERVNPHIFRDCPASRNAHFAVNSSNPVYCAIDGQLYKKNDEPSGTYSLAQVSCAKAGSFTVAANTTAILSSAMSFCIEITSLTIPATVASIDADATYVMRKLANITLLCETPPAFKLNGSGHHWAANDYCAGYGVSGPKTITVPAGCLEAYTGTEGNRTDWWKQYHDIAGYEFTE